MPDATGTKPDAVTEREFTIAERSQAQLVLRRFVRHRAAMVSLVVLVALVLLAYVGGWLWRYDVGEITPSNSQPPSLQHRASRRPRPAGG